MNSLSQVYVNSREVEKDNPVFEFVNKLAQCLFFTDGTM